MVDGERFDGLVRRFAAATSRRSFLRGLMIGATGTVVARGHLVRDAAAQNADCAAFCQQLPAGPQRGRCVSEAASGTGPCFQCGPAASDPAQQLCGETCADTATDVMNCGQCGIECGPGESCAEGGCITPCPAGETPCDGTCVSTSDNPEHCGSCENRCVYANAAALCVDGLCALGACESEWGNCNGDLSDGCETFLSDDPGNCGRCNKVCPTPVNATATCAAGNCSFICLDGFASCDGDLDTGCETDLLTDPDHCGSCKIDCPAGPNEVATCTDGACGTECAEGFSPCGETEACCPDGFCLDGVCVGGICSRGALGCNPGPRLCRCERTYAGPTTCTPAGLQLCGEPSCDESDSTACPKGSYCQPTSCGAGGAESGRCAPIGFCETNLGCGTANCLSGQTCQEDGTCA